MKNAIEKIIITALLLGQLSFTACSDSEKTPETEFETKTITALETTTYAINPELPERNYDGYKFRLLATDEVGSIRYSYEIDAAEQNGEAMNDAVYRRNLMVEEKFGVDISKVEGDSKSYLQMFQNSVLAGDNSYDILVSTYENVMKNGLDYGLDINELEYVDLDNPWWDGDFLRETALCGKIWGLTGDINIVDNSAAWCMLYNKRLAEEFCDEDIYSLVRKGEWTIDRLAEYSRSATGDINGNGELDYDDRFGLLASSNVGMEMIWTSGGGFSKLLDDGSVEFTLDSERNIDVLTKSYKLFSDPDAVLLTDRMTPVDGLNVSNIHRLIFREGRGLFYGQTLNNTENFRDMKDDFGIIPMPKYDEAQESYMTSAQEWCATMFMVPKNAPDAERTGIILDAMCSASVSTITPAYFDTLLTNKLVRDEDSIEMLEIIFDSRRFDIAYTYNWGSLRTLIKIFSSDSDGIASRIAGLKNSVIAEYENLFERYKNS